MPTRRTILLSALAVTATAATTATAAATGATGSAAAASADAARSGADRSGATRPSGSRSGDGLRLKLPEPSGPSAVGTVSLRLVDASRHDPWRAELPYRELMVSIRYPARASAAQAHPRAPQMLPGEAAGFAAVNNFTGVPGDKVDWAATRTHAREGAPADLRPGRRRPVVLYSPGVVDPRSLGSTLCDDLASRGYVVVTIDHTYEATAVEFPGGRVESTLIPAELEKTGGDEVLVRGLLRKTLAVRVADTRFVLDELAAGFAGARTRGLPAATGQALLRALNRAMDLDRIGMFGHSAGGFTALQTMHDDPRLRAGVNLDGVLAYVQEDADPGHYASVAADGLDRPFLLMGKDGNDLSTVPSWGALSRNSHGGGACVTLDGAAHATYTDAEALIPQIARGLGLPDKTVADIIGTIGPRHAISAQRARLTAFFDRELSR